MGKDKFRPSEAFLFRKKPAADRKAQSLRKEGFRVEVNPTQKVTRKRSPSLKWAVFRGQRRK